MTVAPTQSSETSLSLAEIDRQLAERLWIGFIALISIATPISLLRALDTGWIPLYTIHATCFALLFVLHLLRRRIPHAVRKLIVVCYLFGMATIALFIMGILGFGSLWLVVSAYLIGTVYGTRAGWIAVAAVFGLLLLAMYLFTHGVLDVPVDPGRYVTAPISWIMAVSMVLVLPLMLLGTLQVHRNAVMALAQESERRRLEIEHLATHDQLTGLVQRRLARDRLQMAINHARRANRKVALLYVDLDGFKQINDSHGHSTGDVVLQAVGRRLHAAIRTGDTAARLGGDEFLVILADVERLEVVGKIANRILLDIALPVEHGELRLNIGASIGIALFPDHGQDPETLERAADAAMYQVKREGKNAVATAVVTPTSG
jgi:diguanylate cyclase (GGDEF)-like protein